MAVTDEYDSEEGRFVLAEIDEAFGCVCTLPKNKGDMVVIMSEIIKIGDMVELEGRGDETLLAIKRGEDIILSGDYADYVEN